MDKFVVEGGKKLEGTVGISGSKNAVLPLMAATLLASGTFEIQNVPYLRDVVTMSHLLRIIGAEVTRKEDRLSINTERCSFFEAPYELVKTMRASIYVLGPLLGRFGQSKVSYPGGCSFGPRPINLHLETMKALGALIELESGYIVAKCDKLKGAEISFPVSSVGATGNALMAAVLAKGTTILRNAAIEPEIVALEEFLIDMGARIEGKGKRTVVVEGVETLNPVSNKVIPDRIEAGTYIIAGIITGGDITLEGVNTGHLTVVIDNLREVGAGFESEGDNLRVKAPVEIQPVSVTTEVYPGFPTDMQAQWIALMSVAKGVSTVIDTIFPTRFNHVSELKRFGAQIEINNNKVEITGVRKLRGAPVMSSDLRASASLILAALVAEGKSDISRIYHVDRGYEKIEEKLKGLGAQIVRTEGSL